MNSSPFGPTCPCGTGDRYAACCAPLHRGARPAGSAEELMRARYCAYALGELDYVFTTWHPRTRPDDITGGPTWTGLEIHASGTDWVEFTAHYRTPDGTGALHERSRFVQRAGRWVYLDGELS